MITMTIGEKIKARRKELGLTTEELGRMIGVPTVLHPNTRVTIYQIAI